MKELSIEEKAKRYDEALERANELNYVSDKDSLQHKTVEYIFPELKENYSSELKESERIRKVLVDYFKSYKEQEECGIKTFYGIPTDNIIAWLEKKGNINPTEDELKALRIAAYEPTKNWSEKLQSLYEKLTNCEQGEQKPVIEMKTPEESLGIDSDTYNKIVDECIYGEQKHTDKSEPKDYSSIDPHFFKTTDNVEPKFKVGDSIISTISNIPYYITEVCNGHYLTDVGCIIMFNAQDNFELVEQKPAWSEEDETKIKSIIALLKSPALCTMDGNKGIIDESIKYLKSLKDRVQPQLQQGWTEEDERIIKRIKSLLYAINENDFEDIYAWLKFLKDRVQPKQEWSKEDEVKINRIVACLENLNVADNDILLKDVDWLKSLKERVENEKDKHQ